MEHQLGHGEQEIGVEGRDPFDVARRLGDHFAGAGAVVVAESELLDGGDQGDAQFRQGSGLDARTENPGEGADTVLHDDEAEIGARAPRQGNGRRRPRPRRVGRRLMWSSASRRAGQRRDRSRQDHHRGHRARRGASCASAKLAVP